MFSIASTHQLLLVLIFWSLKFYNVDDISFLYMMVDAGVAITTILDGLFINRIPIRLKHYPAIAIMAILYILWTVIHGYVIIKNPDADFDGGIYEAIMWKENFIGCIVLATSVLFIVGPIVLFTLWSLSIMLQMIRHR